MISLECLDTLAANTPIYDIMRYIAIFFSAENQLAEIILLCLPGSGQVVINAIRPPDVYGLPVIQLIFKQIV